MVYCIDFESNTSKLLVGTKLYIYRLRLSEELKTTMAGELGVYDDF